MVPENSDIDPHLGGIAAFRGKRPETFRKGRLVAIQFFCRHEYYIRTCWHQE